MDGGIAHAQQHINRKMAREVVKDEENVAVNLACIVPFDPLGKDDLVYLDFLLCTVNASNICPIHIFETWRIQKLFNNTKRKFVAAIPITTDSQGQSRERLTLSALLLFFKELCCQQIVCLHFIEEAGLIHIIYIFPLVLVE